MRLCIVISSLRAGGAERAATTLANYWIKKGWKVTIITFAGSDQDFYSVSSDVKRIALNKTGDTYGVLTGLWNNFSRVRALRHAIKRENADIALGFMPSSNILCGLACIGTGVVAVGSEQNHPPAQLLRQPWPTLRRLVYPRLFAVSSLTAKSAAWIRVHTRARRVPIIPNPITYPLPNGDPVIDPSVIRKLLGGEKVLLAVGRLVEQKGFDRLLTAFSLVYPAHPEWRLVILGEGPLRENLNSQRDELDLARIVALPGVVGNLGAWYSAADAYVMTSRFEGFGNTLAEALTYGLPSVAVDCETGPSDIIRHDIDGILVPQDNLDALVRALNRLLGDADLRQKFSQRAVDARERFAIDRSAGIWTQIFKEALNEKNV